MAGYFNQMDVRDRTLAEMEELRKKRLGIAETPSPTTSQWVDNGMGILVAQSPRAIETLRGQEKARQERAKRAKAFEEKISATEALGQRMAKKSNYDNQPQLDTYGYPVNPGDVGLRRGGPETTGWGSGGNAYRFGANDKFGKLYKIDQYGKKVYL